MNAFIDVIEMAAKQQYALDKRSRGKRWQERCEQALAGGAGAAHAMTRLSPEYEEEVYKQEDGTLTGDITVGLQQQRDSRSKA
eukprot:1140741-Pyramimonas_sp.AAC.1